MDVSAPSHSNRRELVLRAGGRGSLWKNLPHSSISNEFDLFFQSFINWFFCIFFIFHSLKLNNLSGITCWQTTMPTNGRHRVTLVFIYSLATLINVGLISALLLALFWYESKQNSCTASNQVLVSCRNTRWGTAEEATGKTCSHLSTWWFILIFFVTA